MSNELSEPVQQLVLIYDGERSYFKDLWTIYVDRKVGYFATSANSTWSPFENGHLALGGCSTLHQQSIETNLGLASF